jgi:DNA-binding NarL/FixJ family response regulator
MDVPAPMNGNVHPQRISVAETCDSVLAISAAAIPLVAPQLKARILVVEDHPFVRQEIVDLVNSQGDMSCCGETDSVAATPSAIAEFAPDLVLMDLRLKDGYAFALINSLKAILPRLPIVILSQCDEVLHAERALRAGAKGYVLKQEAVDELLNALRTVLAGKLYVSDAMMGGLLKRVIQTL